MKYTRNCPNCNKELIYKNYESFLKLKRRNALCRKCASFTDLTGKVMNSFKVIGLHKKGRYNLWKTECLNCGYISIKDTSHVNKNYGCKCCNMLKKGEVGLKMLYGAYQWQAKKTYGEFSLNLDDFQILTSSNCYYCGSAPSQKMHNRCSSFAWGDYIYNGIDRKDNAIGYFLSNCVPCCNICNWIKGAKNSDEFKDYIRNVIFNIKNNNSQFLLERK